VNCMIDTSSFHNDIQYIFSFIKQTTQYQMMRRPIILPDHFILGLVIIKKRLMIKKALITLMLCRGDIGRTFFGVYAVLIYCSWKVILIHFALLSQQLGDIARVQRRERKFLLVYYMSEKTGSRVAFG